MQKNPSLSTKEEPLTGESQFFTFSSPPDGFRFQNGEMITPLTLAYETYGRLNQSKTNAVLITHALSGDAHVAGYQPGKKSTGWWHGMVGQGKAFDTDRYFVICSNVIGGCRGSTGPSSINPLTEKPYGLDFPAVTIGDMVKAQKELVDHLGIKWLLSVAGGSMGGMQVLEWMSSYPDTIRSAIPISTALTHTPQQIAFNEVARQAIMADPNWRGGDYYGKSLPAKGLALARMVGHITYMSEQSMSEKFGRQVKPVPPKNKFENGFEVEGYLHYQGNSFVDRFDANSYLYLTKAMDLFDAGNKNEFAHRLRGHEIKTMVIAFKSDWLYTPAQTREIVQACKLADIEATYCEVKSYYGHDAFLLEITEETHLIKHFLDRLYEEEMRNNEGR